jgi:hypothetical protein
VFAEAAAGNMKPLAKVLAIYPVAGELIGDIKSIAKMKPDERQGLERLVSNYMAVGGFGLVSDIVQSAQWGGLAGTAMGPTADDILDLGESLLTGDPGRFLRHQVDNPTIRGARTLVSGTAYIMSETLEGISKAISPETAIERFRPPGRQR